MVNESLIGDVASEEIIEMEKANRELTEVRARETSARMAEEARQEALRRKQLEQEREEAEARRKAEEDREQEEAAARNRAIEQAKAEQRAREQAALEAARAEIAEKLSTDDTGTTRKLPAGEDDAERESVIKRFPPVNE
jgi:hypothetical protein